MAAQQRPLSGAPEPLTSTLEGAITSFTTALPSSSHHAEAWWLAVQTAIALALATGAPLPLFLAARALLQLSPPTPPPPTAHGTPDGASSMEALAPGMGYRLASLCRAYTVDTADAATDGLGWRTALGLAPPPPLQASSSPGSRRSSKAAALTPPELTPEMTPVEAAAALLGAVSGRAGPHEARLLGLCPMHAADPRCQLRRLSSIRGLAKQLASMADVAEPASLSSDDTRHLYAFCAIEVEPRTLGGLIHLTLHALSLPAGTSGLAHSVAPSVVTALISEAVASGSITPGASHVITTRPYSRAQAAIASLRLLLVHLLALRRASLDRGRLDDLGLALPNDSPALARGLASLEELSTLRERLVALVATPLPDGWCPNTLDDDEDAIDGSDDHGSALAQRLCVGLRNEALGVLLAGERLFFAWADERAKVTHALLGLLHVRTARSLSVAEHADVGTAGSLPLVVLADGLLHLFAHVPGASQLLAPMHDDHLPATASSASPEASSWTSVWQPPRQATEALLQWLLCADELLASPSGWPTLSQPSCINSQPSCAARTCRVSPVIGAGGAERGGDCGVSPSHSPPLLSTLSSPLTFILDIVTAHATCQLDGRAEPIGGEAAIVMLCAQTQELCGRAALDDSINDPSSRALHELVSGMLNATHGLLSGREADGSKAGDSGRDGTIPDAKLSVTFMARVLPYALDALYQMPVHQLPWAKRLSPTLHKLAGTPTLLGISARGAAGLFCPRSSSVTPGAGSRRSSLAHLDGQESCRAFDASTEAVEPKSSIVESLTFETAHPLPAEPELMVCTVNMDGATHLRISFDARCSTHSSDVLRVQLPAPRLPEGWTLDSEIIAHASGSYAGAAVSDASELERQARREEFKGHYGHSYALFMAAYAISREPVLLLSAARIKLRSLGDPHVAAALLAGVVELVPPLEGTDGRVNVAAAARLLLVEARKACEAGMGRTLEFAGGPSHWPRRPLILPGCQCTITLAPSDDWPESQATGEHLPPASSGRRANYPAPSPPLPSPPPSPPSVPAAPVPPFPAARGRSAEEVQGDEDAALAALIASMDEVEDDNVASHQLLSSPPRPASCPSSAPHAVTTLAAAENSMLAAHLSADAEAPMTPVVQAQVSGEDGSAVNIAQSVLPPELLGESDVTSQIVTSGEKFDTLRGHTKRDVTALAREPHVDNMGPALDPFALLLPAAPLSRWTSVRCSLPAVLEIGRRRARRMRDPQWGVRIEVCVWEPPHADQAASASQQLVQSVGYLLARHAAVLVAGEPLVDPELEQQRWLGSPLFSSGFNVIHLPLAHPLSYLTGRGTPNASPVAAVAAPIALDGVEAETREILADLAARRNLSGLLHEAMLLVTQPHSLSLSSDGWEATHSCMCVWFLVHAGLAHDVRAVLNKYSRSIETGGMSSSALHEWALSFEAKRQAAGAEPSEAMPVMDQAMVIAARGRVSSEEALLLLMLLRSGCANCAGDRDANRADGSGIGDGDGDGDGEQPVLVTICGRLEVVWRAADGLTREMRKDWPSEAAITAYVELLLRTSPQAAPCPPAAIKRTPHQVSVLCATLHDETMQWLHSRADPGAIKTCLTAQQQRAFSRASGMRLTAATLSMYAAQPPIIAHLLELLQQARVPASRGQPLTTALTEPMQPHYLHNLECAGLYATAQLRTAFATMLEGLTALIESETTADTLGTRMPLISSAVITGGIRSAGHSPARGREAADSRGEAIIASADCRVLALRALHMPITTDDCMLISSSPLMQRLRLNGRGTGREARCCRLLWSILASMCLQPNVEGGSAWPAAGELRVLQQEHCVPRLVSRQASWCERASPWSTLLDQLCDAVAVRLQGSAIRAQFRRRRHDAGGSVQSAGVRSAIEMDVVHESRDVAMTLLEEEARHEAALHAECEKNDGSVGNNEGGNSLDEARDRRETEDSLVSMLGLLVHACAENADLAAALAMQSWLRVLLATCNYGSPRCLRLAMRLLARVLPLCKPADVPRVPDPEAMRDLSRPFHTAPEHSSDGEQLLPYLFGIVGRELTGEGHMLGCDHTGWRPATAWQPMVDATVSLLRRLLLAETWRPLLFAVIDQAIASAPSLLRHDPYTKADEVAYAALATFCVLGGHIWTAAPGARVAVLAPDDTSGASSSSGSGTVLRGDCGAADYEIVLDGTARGWRSPLIVPAERVVPRPNVVLTPSLVGAHFAASGGNSGSMSAAWMASYQAILSAEAGSTPLGSLLRSRALLSLQWLTEDTVALRMLLDLGLFPSLVSTAVRPAPLAATCSRDDLSRRLLNIEVAARELHATRRPPRLLSPHDASGVSNSELCALLGARNAFIPSPRGPPEVMGDVLGGGENRHDLLAATKALLDGRCDAAAAESCTALAAGALASCAAADSETEGSEVNEGGDDGNVQSMVQELPVTPQTRSLHHSPSWEGAFGIVAILTEMGLADMYPVGCCRAALKAVTRGRHPSEEQARNNAVAWLMERSGAAELPGRYDEPPSQEELIAGASMSRALEIEASEGGVGSSAADSVIDGEGWFSVPDEAADDHHDAAATRRARQSRSGRAGRASVAASQSRFQTLEVTRPLTGNTVLPGQQIIVADPRGNRYRTTVPPSIAPGQTFHVRVPAPEPVKTGTAADEHSEESEHMAMASIGEFIPLALEVQRDSVTGSSPVATLAGAVVVAPSSSRIASAGSSSGGGDYGGVSGTSGTGGTATSAGSGQGTASEQSLCRLEVYRGAPLWVARTSGEASLGLVCDATWGRGGKLQTASLVVRDGQSDELRIVTVGEWAATDFDGARQPRCRSLHLPETVAMAGLAAVGEPLDANALARLRARAQAALGALAMRRAVMNAIPVMLLNQSAAQVEEAGGSGDSRSGETSKKAVIGASSQLGSLSSLVDDPRQLHLLLKLAHAAGGTHFDAIFDGLRTLLGSLPSGMAALPELLCNDALRHIRRITRATAEHASRHPLGTQARSRCVARLCVEGAAAIRVEVDARSVLPHASENKSGGAVLLVSPTPRAEDAVRTYRGSAAHGGWMPVVLPSDTAFLIYTPGARHLTDADRWGWRVRAIAESWRPYTEEETLRMPLPLGWPMLWLLLKATPASLTLPAVFDTLVDTLRHPSNGCKEEAAAMLLRLLHLSSSELRGTDMRASWRLSSLLPLHRAVTWHAARPEPSKLLPRHAQLYAEIIAAVPGSGSLTEVCLPASVVEDARRRVVGGSALPSAVRSNYQQLATVGSALVGILDEYRAAFDASNAPSPSAELCAAFDALPAPPLCAAARVVLKRWLREEGETEVIPPGADARWSPALDAELLVAMEAFKSRLRRKSVCAITPAEMVHELSQLKANFVPAYEDVAVRCIGLMRIAIARTRQRWLLLRRLNTEIEQIIAYAHTGWCAQPHTLGSRLCALRGLILMEVKRRLWDAALPSGPSDEGVVKSGHVVSVNRFEAEAARADAEAGLTDTKHKTLFRQLFTQLHTLDPKLLRRRDRAFKVRFTGEAADDYGGPFREAITNLCGELQCAASELFILTPNGQQGSGNNRSAFTIRPSVARHHLAEFAFFGKILGCAMLQRELVLDLDLSEHVWKRLAHEALTDFDLASFDAAALSSLRQLRNIEEQGVDEETFKDIFFETFEATLSDGSTIELIDDGAATDVTFSTRGQFVNLAIRARLDEGSEACDAILAGMAAIVPSARLVRLFTGPELMHLTCGEADIDIANLRAHTSYGQSASANMHHVRFFWATLEAFTPEQRRLFLKFIWGRNRLPFTEEDWGQQRMKIHTLEKPTPDQYFPVAHTCFFSIELPKYTSREVCYSKLLWAVNNCSAIDADNTSEGRANMASNAFT